LPVRIYGPIAKGPNTCGGIMSKPNLELVTQENGKIKISIKAVGKKKGRI
jgi:hypothetical protein